MNKRYSIIMSLVCFLTSFSICNAQTENGKSEQIYKLTDTKNEISIKASTFQVKSDLATYTVKVEVDKPGNYYIGTWCMPPASETPDSKMEISVNGKKLANSFKFKNNNWQASYLKNEKGEVSTINLEKGINTITFISSVNFPLIEKMQLSSSPCNLENDNAQHMSYVNSLKNSKLPKNYIAEKKNSAELKSSVLPNPAGNYSHVVDLEYNYTFWTTIYLTAGQTVTFETKNSNSDPVMFIFNYSNPSLGSWMNDDGGEGLNSKLTVTAPQEGTYYLLLRAYSSSYPGVCDLYKDEAQFYASAAIAGTIQYCATQKTGNLNFFSWINTGDTRLWLYNYWNGPIVAANDDFYNSGDFYWGLSSRIKQDFSTAVSYCLVSAYSPSTTGTCDLYMACENSTIMSYFPNLKAEDAIQSAPQTNDYNCASWGGGLTDRGRYFWASSAPTSTNLSSNWYVANNFWLSWDNFFGNNPPRFAGAPTYTRSGASASNGDVAMWYNSTSGQYTHFSVKKPANNQPHGYDWESKPGGLMRTFHPKDALVNNSMNGYGEISQYYTLSTSGSSIEASLADANSTKTYSLEESVKLGLTVIPNINLSTDELLALAELRSNIDKTTENEFNNMFQRLITVSNTPNLIIHSNPYFLYQTKEFKDVLSYCKNKGEAVWPLLFENVFETEDLDTRDISVLLLNEVTQDYSFLMDTVKKEWSMNNYNEEGAYIAPSPIDNTKNYVKKLIVLKSGASVEEIDENQKPDNHNMFSVYPNPFTVQTTVSFVVDEDNSSVSLSVFDINGNLLETVFANQIYNTGQFDIEWTADNYSSGLYYFTLSVNNQSLNRRFLIE